MQKMTYTTHINAPAAVVWDVLLGEETYPQWTEVFNPEGGSYVEGDWSEGSNIKFLGKDPNTGEIGGMYAHIEQNKPAEFLSIKHIGMIRNGEIDTESDEIKVWTPAYENYTLVETDGETDITVEMDVAEDYLEMFNDMWPKALAVLKELAEQK